MKVKAKIVYYHGPDETVLIDPVLIRIADGQLVLGVYVDGQSITRDETYPLSTVKGFYISALVAIVE